MLSLHGTQLAYAERDNEAKLEQAQLSYDQLNCKVTQKMKGPSMLFQQPKGFSVSTQYT